MLRKPHPASPHTLFFVGFAGDFALFDLFIIKATETSMQCNLNAPAKRTDSVHTKPIGSIFGMEAVAKAFGIERQHGLVPTRISGF